MVHSGEIIQCLNKKEAEMVDLLESLVNIDSGTYLKEGVNQIGNIIVPKLHELGFEVERRGSSSRSERGNFHKEAPLHLPYGYRFPGGGSQKTPLSH
jgi:glutamate carboxypeptidase